MPNSAAISDWLSFKVLRSRLNLWPIITFPLVSSAILPSPENRFVSKNMSRLKVTYWVKIYNIE